MTTSDRKIGGKGRADQGGGFVQKMRAQWQSHLSRPWDRQSWEEQHPGPATLQIRPPSGAAASPTSTTSSQLCTFVFVASVASSSGQRHRNLLYFPRSYMFCAAPPHDPPSSGSGMLDHVVIVTFRGLQLGEG